MKNITGNPVTHDDFLKTRLPLVDELRNVLRNSPVIIEAPRRSGKTSLVKELIRQEETKKKKEQEFKILFFDLESFLIPPAAENESRFLIESLSQQYGLQIEPPGVTFMVSKITNGHLYLGQLLFKALIQSGEKEFTEDKVKSIYKIMLRKGNHDFNHFHSRLEEYLTPLERECSEVILNHLCAGPDYEKKIYDSFLYEKCSYELFRSVVDRLLFEGYIIHDPDDNGKLRFVSPMLKDWWCCKKGLTDVCV